MTHNFTSKVFLFSLKIKLNCHFTICFTFYCLLRRNIFYIFNAYYFLKSIDVIAHFYLKKFFDILFTTFRYRILKLKSLFENTYKFLILFLYFYILLSKFKYFAFSIKFHINTRNTCKLVVSLIIN